MEDLQDKVHQLYFALMQVTEGAARKGSTSAQQSVSWDIPEFLLASRGVSQSIALSEGCSQSASRVFPESDECSTSKSVFQVLPRSFTPR